MSRVHVKDLMTKDVVSVDMNATVNDAAKKMAENNTGTVVVAENRKVRGLVIDRDIVIKAIGQGLNINEASVREIMVENLVTVKENDLIFDAAKACAREGPFRRVPVVNENDECVGILSTADMALVAHPLLEAIMLETASSVRQVDVQEPGVKRDLHQLIPEMTGR